jgi:hypothetical protein
MLQRTKYIKPNYIWLVSIIIVFGIGLLLLGNKKIIEDHNMSNNTDYQPNIIMQLITKNESSSEPSIESVIDQNQQIFSDNSVQIALSNKKSMTENMATKYFLNFKNSKKFDGLEKYSGTFAEKLVMDFYFNVQAKNWQAALDMYPELVSYYPINETLSLFILKEAPLKVITSFIDSGMYLSDQAIGPLISRELPVIKRLIPYGLNIHAVYSNAYNALTTPFGINAEVFDFMLKEGVATKPVKGGLDALDTALILVYDYAEAISDLSISSKSVKKGKSDAYGKAFYFVDQLVNYGVQIEDSHLALVLSIKDTSPVIYKALVENTPEFIYLLGSD